MQAKLTHLIIHCAEISALEAFYTGFFGQAASGTKASWREFQLTGLVVALQESDEKFANSPTTLALVAEDFDAEVARLAAAGIVPIKPERLIGSDPRTQVRWLVFTDPEGNQIGVYGA